MSVSFSYKYLALFTETGWLWTGLSNLQVSRLLCQGVGPHLCGSDRFLLSAGETE